MANRFLIVCGGSGTGVLGQRKVLGIDGEMQIDVREEIKEELSRSDPRSINVVLDKPPSMGTAPTLLSDMTKRAQKKGVSKQHKAHTEFLAQYWPGDEALKDGLARIPAFGAGAITERDNTLDLHSKLRKMINEWANVGPANPVEFWIVSSSAGGTGEGVHLYVAEKIIDILTARRGARVILNFVRIGQETYNSVDPDRTSLNTFFGIAADAAFKVRLPQQYRESVGVTTRWFYLEVPDVGVGPTAKPIRERLVEVAAKAIMLEELAADINTIVVNDGVGLVRVGYWGRDFDEKVKYHETLKQLRDKLSDLVEPSGFARYVHNKPEPDFDPGQRLTDLRQELAGEGYIYQQMLNQAWEFPKYQASRFSTDPNEAWKIVRRWRDSISQLVPNVSMDALEPRFVTAQASDKEGSDELETRQVPLSVPGLGSAMPYTKAWFEKIDNAHRVVAWANHMLGTGRDEKRLLAELHSLARECSRKQHPPFPASLSSNTQKKATDLRTPLPDFVETLVKVTKLWQLREAAQTMLSGALEGAEKLQGVVKQQLKIVSSAVTGVQESPVVAADLDHELDQITKDTWLRMLDEARRRDQPDLFREQVLAGATGLTWAGLLSVLGLSTAAEAPEVKAELRKHMGQIYDADGEVHEAAWWQFNDPPGVIREFNYRILPRLEADSVAKLGDSDGEIKYIYAGLGVIGLYVLAFHGVTRSVSQDMVTTPTYLMSPFVPLVRKFLDPDAWGVARYGRPQNKLHVVCAGTGGALLYRPALVAAGLTEEEIGMLAGFYEFYDPQVEEEEPGEPQNQA